MVASLAHMVTSLTLMVASLAHMVASLALMVASLALMVPFADDQSSPTANICRQQMFVDDQSSSTSVLPGAPTRTRALVFSSPLCNPFVRSAVYFQTLKNILLKNVFLNTILKTRIQNLHLWDRRIN